MPGKPREPRVSSLSWYDKVLVRIYKESTMWCNKELVRIYKKSTNERIFGANMGLLSRGLLKRRPLAPNATIWGLWGLLLGCFWKPSKNHDCCSPLQIYIYMQLIIYSSTYIYIHSQRRSRTCARTVQYLGLWRLWKWHHFASSDGPHRLWHGAQGLYQKCSASDCTGVKYSLRALKHPHVYHMCLIYCILL